MKKLICLSITLVSILVAVAQNDTVINYKNNKIYLSEDKQGDVKVRVTNSPSDSVENLIFEGKYDDTSRAEVTFIYPLARVIPSEKIQKRSIYDFIFCNYYFGFTNLGSRSLQFTDKKVGPLDFTSYEIGYTIFGADIPVAPKKGWSSFIGLTFRSLLYSTKDNNKGFKIINNQLTQVSEPEGINYNDCQLGLFYCNIPMMFEWRKVIGKRNKTKFYIQTGLDMGILLFANASNTWKIDNGIYMTEVIQRKRLNVNPISLDFKTEIGFDWFALYVRYGLIETFQRNSGSNVIPVSIGIAYKI